MVCASVREDMARRDATPFNSLLLHQRAFALGVWRDALYLMLNIGISMKSAII